jgi:hypothetical protein
MGGAPMDECGRTSASILIEGWHCHNRPAITSCTYLTQRVVRFDVELIQEIKTLLRASNWYKPRIDSHSQTGVRAAQTPF